MIGYQLWRPAHEAVEEMRGVVPEEKNYAIGWTLSAFLTLSVVGVVWTFGF